jgi:hypothetical protein
MRLHEIVDPTTYWTPDRVKAWSKYMANLSFETPEEARAEMFRQLERDDKSTWAKVTGKINGTELNRQLAEIIPLYRSGNRYKIGRMIRQNTRLKLSDIKIVLPNKREIINVAQANGTEDFDILPVKWYSISVLIGEQNDSYFRGNEGERIRNLAKTIKQSKWIEAVIVAYNPDEQEPWLVEGQHRTRAMRLLGFKKVPAVAIRYESD